MSLRHARRNRPDKVARGLPQLTGVVLGVPASGGGGPAGDHRYWTRRTAVDRAAVPLRRGACITDSVVMAKVAGVRTEIRE